MRLFDIINGELVINNPNVLAVPEFRVIWERDKDSDKENAVKDLSYVVFLCDESLHNPYRAYKELDREATLKKDFIGDINWVPDKELQAAIDKYREATETTISRLLVGAKSAAEKLAEYFHNVDFSLLDAQGKPIYSAREVSTNIGSVGNIVKSLNSLEEMVRKEQLETSVVRGGGEIGFFENPMDDIDYGTGDID